MLWTEITEGGAGTFKVFQARDYKGYKGVSGGRWGLKLQSALEGSLGPGVDSKDSDKQTFPGEFQGVASRRPWEKEHLHNAKNPFSQSQITFSIMIMKNKPLRTL